MKNYVLLKTRESGFTLIELLIVISITVILSTAGIASFISYNNSQTLKSAGLDISTLLKSAKDKSLSQVKSVSDAQCPTMNGYQVTISTLSTPNTYQLELLCTSGRFVQGQAKPLSPGLYFDQTNGIGSTFLFQVISGTVLVDGVSKTGKIIICQGNCSKQTAITIKKDGNISLQ